MKIPLVNSIFETFYVVVVKTKQTVEKKFIVKSKTHPWENFLNEAVGTLTMIRKLS